MSGSEATRKAVSEAYARMVSSGTGCGCGTPAVPKGVAAKLAGYREEDLAGLPAEAVANSFGCGNPLAMSEVREGETVLDLGSGAGIDLLIAARRVGPKGRVIGVDMTDDMIDRARQSIAAAGLGNVEVRKGIIEDLPVESGSVDLVISNCVINLSPEKPRVFAEIARVLRPGGRMLVSDIVVRDLPSWVAQSFAMYASCVAGAISEDDYLVGLRNAGLADVAVRERLTYDGAQIAAFVESDLPDLAKTSPCCGASVDAGAIRAAAEALSGKIWSAKFFARKPGCVADRR
ncbi:MAG: arsenite methyltransferase [Myxococcota bacterium]|nr:arsenite methyltransferase [Myxococcota bacterium]